jgi:Superinfection immunity protein
VTFFVIFLFMYFVPSVIAFARGHHQKAAILALNLFLGWTMIGWVVAIVWALTRVDYSNGNRRVEDTFR